MPGYTVSTPSETLSAATAKTVASVVGGATRRFRVRRLSLGGSSVTATDAAVLVEMGVTNQATAGTSTSVTPFNIDRGETAAIATAARTYTVEPTTYTIGDNIRLSPIGNTFLWEMPITREWFCSVSTTFGVRCTAPATQTSNWQTTIYYEE